MAQVCKWLGFYLCMKDTPKTDTIYPDCQAFDAVIVWREARREKSGGLAYEVILKPASIESPARPPSPPKTERPLSQEDIEKKLAEADERRQQQELTKLESAKKVKERTIAANQRIDELNRSFSKETEKKLTEKLESMELKKSLQMQALQERLKEHRIDQKLEVAQENREKQVKVIQERIKEHSKHVQEIRAMKAKGDATE
ncbi:hypothetical protein LSH36_457g02041 [Paralvinella palmiformis]|uniref:Stathmin n=1 Tax=Paralvinella palmiformis TaxID=53620 RepID=A0AAD9JA25_9ANNE|nr:hypothetical protein LSH36_457g02041 [Paralvinella palmiformis]